MSHLEGGGRGGGSLRSVGRRGRRRGSELIQIGQVSLCSKGSSSALEMPGKNKRNGSVSSMFGIALRAKKRVCKFRIQRGRTSMGLPNVVEGTGRQSWRPEGSEPEKCGGVKHRVAAAEGRARRDGRPDCPAAGAAGR